MNKKSRTDQLQLILDNLIPRLSDSEYVENILNKNKNYNYSTLDKYSLCKGFPSLCILFSELHMLYPDKGYDIIRDNYFANVFEYFKVHQDDSLSMVQGLTGIGLSAVCMSYNGNIKNFINKFNDLLLIKVNALLTRLKYKEFMEELFYDIMYGVSGVANYCMLFPESSKMMNILNDIVQYLVDICKDKQIRGAVVPGCIVDNFSSPFRLVNKVDQCYFNLGLSHGIPGILLVLVNTYKLGIRIEGQLDTIRKLSDLIKKCIVTKSENGQYWKSSLTLDEYISNILTEEEKYRDAWCYGSPGVSFSILVTGMFLNDNQLTDIAIDNMKISLERKRNVSSMTFCHGLSGLMYLSFKFYEFTHIECFKHYYLELMDLILDSYDVNIPFGFKNHEIIGDIDDVGILTGTTGILLCLLSLIHGNQTPWDAAFSLYSVDTRIRLK